MDRILAISVELDCPPATAFTYFTENEKLATWLTAKANVLAEVGGPYELFWQPDDPANNSTIGCKVLAVDVPYYLNFEWKGPVRFRSFMNSADPLTNVTVIFHPDGANTKVSLIHSGWRSGDDWDDAFNYFEGAWTGALMQLQEKINPTR